MAQKEEGLKDAFRESIAASANMLIALSNERTLGSYLASLNQDIIAARMRGVKTWTAFEDDELSDLPVAWSLMTRRVRETAVLEKLQEKGITAEFLKIKKEK